ncbi:hypothetical protein H7X87_01495, partial [Acetobacteraceae bacterium]|nr:hypothetical protein [Candidatus Parcubacteria bacterium]
MDEQPLNNSIPVGYISSREASTLHRVTNDYVARLCKRGKVRGVLVGRNWFVDPNALGAYLGESKLRRTVQKRELSKTAQRTPVHLENKPKPSKPVVNLAAAFALVPEQDLSSARKSAHAQSYGKKIAMAFVVVMAILLVGGVSAAKISTHAPMTAAVAHIDSPFFSSFGSVWERFLALFSTDDDAQYAQSRENTVKENILIYHNPTAASPTPQTVTPQPVVRPSQSATTIVNNYITNPVTERTIVSTSGSSTGINPDAFVMILSELHRSLSDEIYHVVNLSLDHRRSRSSGSSSSGALTITDADVPDTITASNYLPLAGGTLTGQLVSTANATTTFAGGFDISDGCYAVDGICISGSGGGTWGSITGTLSNQTDLQNALDAKLSLTTWYATTTDGLDEGVTNLYYSPARVQTHLDTIAKGYFFSSTSASYFLAQNGGNAFSTTSANNFINSSSTIPHIGGSAYGDVLTWSGTSWVTTATTSLGLPTFADITSGNSFGKSWEIANGALSPTTTIGIGVYASSTIGNGTATEGLTVSGNSTTTGNAYFAGNVGIGTSTPSSQLHIVNTGTPATLTLDSTTGNARFMLKNGNANFYNLINLSSDNSLRVQYNGSSLMTYLPNGNVGIGTAAPGAALAISSTTATTLLNVSSSVNNNFTVLGSGYVGIGTTSPYAKLSVVGDVVAARFVATTTATSTFAGGITASCFSTDGTTCLTSSGGSSFGQDWQITNSYLTPTTTIGIIVAASSTIGDGTLGLTINGGATTTGTAFFAGNVRIASTTASPLAALQISTSTTGQLFLVNSNTPSASGGAFATLLLSQIPTAADQRLGGITFGYNNGGGSSTNRNASAITAYSSEAWTAGTAHGSTLRFETTASGSSSRLERMRIDASGNVGIGTTSPYAKLSVVGDVVAARFVATTTATSTFAGPIQASCFSTDGTTCLTSSGGSSFGQGWEIVNGYLAPTTTIGIIVAASSTIGDGTATGGLTISGNATTTGNLKVLGSGVLSGNSAIDNFFNVTGTLPSVITTSTWGAHFDVTGAGSSNAINGAARFSYNVGYTGSGRTFGVYASNTSEGVGSNLSIGSTGTSPTANTGIYALSSAASVTSGIKIGGMFEANSSSGFNFGTIGKTVQNRANATNIAVAGFGRNTSSGGVQIGGYFSLANSTSSIFTSGALIADNSDQTSPIFLAQDNGSTIFSIIDGGNVGIGTTSPYAKLSVAGDVVAARFVATTTATSTFGGGLDIASGCFALAGTCISTGNLGLTGTQGQVAYFSGTNSAVGTSSLFIASSGRIGIGTTTPESIFTVGAAGAVASFGNYTNTTVYSMFAQQSAGVGRAMFGYDSSSNNAVVQGVVSKGIEFNVNSNTFGAGTAMFIDTSGNVGIGTTSPYAKLSVAGNAVFDQQISANYYTATSTTIASTFPYASTTAISSTNASTTNQTISSVLSSLLKTNSTGGVIAAVAGTDYALPGETAFKDWSIQGNGYLAPTTTRGIIVAASSTIGNGTQTGGLTINGGATTTGNQYIAGNVGIGTTSPSTALSVQGTNLRLRLSNSTISTGRMWDLTSGDGGLFTIRDFSAGDLARLSIDSSGNVGIGTTSPALVGSGGTELTVAGLTNNVATNINISGVSSTLDNGVAALNGYGNGVRLGLINFRIGSASNNGQIGFLVNNAGSLLEAMRINSNGNVGIGSSTPWGRLSADTTSLAAGIPSFVVGSSTRTDLIVTQAG